MKFFVLYTLGEVFKFLCLKFQSNTFPLITSVLAKSAKWVEVSKLLLISAAMLGGSVVCTGTIEGNLVVEGGISKPLRVFPLALTISTSSSLDFSMFMVFTISLTLRETLSSITTVGTGANNNKSPEAPSLEKLVNDMFLGKYVAPVETAVVLSTTFSIKTFWDDNPTLSFPFPCIITLCTSEGPLSP
uniref:Uncharacterized protein n=1 Tax=Glossina austeni TaxID=7395 RepID=A0A1A9VQL2_GLOAU